MPDISIRKATEKDAPELRALIRDAMESYRKDSGIPVGLLESLNESVESVAHRIRHGNCLVLCDGSRIIGTVTLTFPVNAVKYSFSDYTEELLSSLSNVGYISRLAVADSARKTGLGLLLMRSALNEAASAGAEHVLLHTAAENRRMKDFYFSLGFRLLDSEHSRGYERGLFAIDIKEEPWNISDSQI